MGKIGEIMGNDGATMDNVWTIIFRSPAKKKSGNDRVIPGNNRAMVGLTETV